MVVHSTTCKAMLMRAVSSIMAELTAGKALFFCSSFGFLLGAVVSVGSRRVHIKLLEIAYIAFQVFVFRHVRDHVS